MSKITTNEIVGQTDPSLLKVPESVTTDASEFDFKKPLKSSQVSADTLRNHDGSKTASVEDVIDRTNEVPADHSVGGDLSGTVGNSIVEKVLGNIPGVAGIAALISETAEQLRAAAGIGSVGTLDVPTTGGTATSSQAVRGDDPRLNDARAPSGSAGGDLAGSYPNPTVDRLSGSVTWDPSNLADGSSETSPSISVAGAALGDFVIVAPPYSPQGLSICGYVDAADVVKITLSNNTGGSIDLGSGTWKVVVLKW